MENYTRVVFLMVFLNQIMNLCISVLMEVLILCFQITWANKNLSPEQIYAKYEMGPKILDNPVDTIKKL